VNPLTADTLTARELSRVVADVRGLLTDTDTAQAVTYYTRGARVYDPARGTVGYSETATTITAHLAPVDLDEVDGAKVGDSKLLIAAADLSSAPAVDDRFRAAGTTYAVYAVQTGALSSHYTAFGHRVN